MGRGYRRPASRTDMYNYNKRTPQKENRRASYATRTKWWKETLGTRKIQQRQNRATLNI